VSLVWLWRLLAFLVCFFLGYFFEVYRERRAARRERSTFAAYAKKEFNREDTNIR
jgi:hypothetical protein